MRQQLWDVAAGARERIGKAVVELQKGDTLTDAEVLERYDAQHRGRPWAILEFAREEVGGRSGLDPEVVKRAEEYEQRMETLRLAQEG